MLLYHRRGFISKKKYRPQYPQWPWKWYAPKKQFLEKHLLVNKKKAGPCGHIFSLLPHLLQHLKTKKLLGAPIRKQCGWTTHRAPRERETTSTFQKKINIALWRVQCKARRWRPKRLLSIIITHHSGIATARCYKSGRFMGATYLPVHLMTCGHEEVAKTKRPFPRRAILVTATTNIAVRPAIGYSWEQPHEKMSSRRGTTVAPTKTATKVQQTPHGSFFSGRFSAVSHHHLDLGAVKKHARPKF